MESFTCGYMAWVLIAGLGANALLHWWWLDAAGALVLVPLLIKGGVRRSRASVAVGMWREGSMRIQLLSHPGCPNASVAHGRLLEALAIAGVAAAIDEVDTTSEATPEGLRGWGSPTVLIDGDDVAGEKPTGGVSCRRYRSAGGLPSVAPSVVLLVAALRHCAG